MIIRMDGSKSGGFRMAAEIGIVSVEAAAIADFYRRAFGFDTVSTFTTSAGSVYKLRQGDARLKIFSPAIAPAGNPKEPLGRREGICYFALYVEDIDASFSQAIDAGAEVIASPMSHRPGAVVAVLRDVGGNIVELLEDHDST